MKSKRRQAFSLLETLVAMLTFSLLLMIFVPAFYTELSKSHKLTTETQKWQLFYELVSIDLDQNLDLVSRATLLEAVIDNHELRHQLSVRDFGCDEFSCGIIFADGSDLYVSLEEIQ